VISLLLWGGDMLFLLLQCFLILPQWNNSLCRDCSLFRYHSQWWCA